MAGREVPVHRPPAAGKSATVVYLAVGPPAATFAPVREEDRDFGVRGGAGAAQDMSDMPSQMVGRFT